MAKARSILIVGGSGFIGTHLAQRLRGEYRVYATSFKRKASISGVTYLTLDVDGVEANREWVKRVVYMTRPDVVIYCAGSNNSKTAEKDSRSTDLAHAIGPATIAAATDILKPKFIYISNGFVFDGSKGNYNENDTVMPLLALGKAKVGGENIVRGRPNYLVIRSGPVYGRGSGNRLAFLDLLRVQLDNQKRIELSTNELHGFIPIQIFTEVIHGLIDGGPKNKVIHLGSLTKTTLYDFGVAFAKKFNYDPKLIIPEKRQEISSGVEAPPLDYSLNFSFAVQNLNFKPFFLEEGLDLFQQSLIT